jgi:hypothetical protein
MPARDDFLQQLSPAIRERIESDYDRYAPLIALLAAWKTEVEGHVGEMERVVIERLARELFPAGAWKFPAQTLAVPEDLARREIYEETVFTDRNTQSPWTPCGPGWTLPTRIIDWKVEQQGWDAYALVFNIQLDSRQPAARLLSPPQPPDDPLGQSQLAFVCASEPIVAELAAAPWALQHPGEPFLPITTSRYQGYLDFERGLGSARSKQRQLESWLPGFYPYSRKFLRFHLPAESAAFVPEEWSWLGDARTIRLAVRISERTADLLSSNSGQEPMILNAFPVCQMRALGEPLLDNPDPVGDSFKKAFAGVTRAFAASMREISPSTVGVQTAYRPCRLLPIASDNPRNRGETDHFEVWYDRPSSDTVTDGRVRIYFDTFGEAARVPTTLSRPGARCTVPFPPLGALDAPIDRLDDAGSKRAWYQTMLRAPQLTQGDVLEILHQCPDCHKYLDLDPDYVSIQLDIENEPWVERRAWDSYLWPTVIPDDGLLERKATYLSRSQVAIIPVMRLVFGHGRLSLPPFLMDDLMQYVASIVSRHFMLGWYRVVATAGAR